jgi:hypothetical protein
MLGSESSSVTARRASVVGVMLVLGSVSLGQALGREPAQDAEHGSPSAPIVAEPEHVRPNEREREPAALEVEPEHEEAPQRSGPHWVDRFPTSRSIDDLDQPFQSKVEAFVGALEAAGANVQIFATRRPAERAYLMRYAWDISHGTLAPADVPAMPGVDIEWDHGDDADSLAAATEMVDYFWLAHRPSLTSRHIKGRAIDMHVTWTGKLSIVDGKGKTRTISSTPRNGAENRALQAVGASYGVHKLATDAPHWSSDGR